MWEGGNEVKAPTFSALVLGPLQGKVVDRLAACGPPHEQAWIFIDAGLDALCLVTAGGDLRGNKSRVRVTP